MGSAKDRLTEALTHEWEEREAACANSECMDCGQDSKGLPRCKPCWVKNQHWYKG